MQTEVGPVEQQHARQHFRRQVEQRDEGEEAEGGVGREVRTVRLVRSDRRPPQRHLAVVLYDPEAVEHRQHPPDVSADQLEPPQVFLLQPMEYGGEVPAVGAKAVVVRNVTGFPEIRRIRRVVELMDGAVPQEMDDGPCDGRADTLRRRSLRDIHDRRLRLVAGDVLPRRIRRGDDGGAERLVAEDEAVRMGVGQREAIVNPARLGAQGELRVHARRYALAVVQLVVRAAPRPDELPESRPQHPAQHLEEPNEVRLAGAVGAHQHVRVAQVAQVDVRERPEPPDAKRLDLACDHRPLPRDGING